MPIIIRLQNLPWSANSADIRRFFSGLSIPEGGVHIVGGEMGDAFIAFSTDEDARLAMAKDGGTIKDMQIKLLLSSHAEMMRVIEQARQQNMVLTQPQMIVSQPAILPLQQSARIMSPTSESDRRRARSPSPHRRSRDRSPVRDRRRSPDDRRGSKRDRSRSPSRSSRSFSRDMDRRTDRFKRDERRYDDSRYRDERRSARDSSQESKKYLDTDHVNSRSQLHATEEFRNTQTVYEQTSNAGMSGLSFGNQQPLTVKNFPGAYTRTPTNSSAQLQQSERVVSHKPMEFPPAIDQKHLQSSAYPHEQVVFRGTPFETTIPSTKDNSVSADEEQMTKTRRRTRFEPEFVPTSVSSHFPPADTKLSERKRETSYNDVRSQPDNFSETRNAWPHEITERSENVAWNEKRQGLLNLPMSKNGDFVQVVPMDLDPSPSDVSPEKEIYHESVHHRGPPPYVRSNPSPRNEDLRRDNQNRGLPPQNDNKEHLMHDRGPLSQNNNRGPVSHDNNSGPVSQGSNRGPVSHGNNRGPVSHDNSRGPVSHDSNRGPSVHNNAPGRIPPSLTVEVRGLPPDARIEDILDLFRGIPLPAANIRIEASEHGFEKALIRFVSVADFEEALNRNRRFMHEGRCELVPCPAAAFDSAPRSQKSKPKPKPREEDLTVQLRGLPFSCTDDDVVTFFDGLGILDLYVDVASDGRATGTGFVEFGTPKDFRAALTMNGKMIGHRYITVSVASKEMLAFARGEEYNPVIPSKRPYSNPHISNNNCPPAPGPNQGRPLPSHIRPPGPPVNQGRQVPPPHQSRPPPPCIAMKGLPEGVTNRDIADFLGERGVMPTAVHIMLRPDKTPSGDAFAEFGGPADLETALQLNGKPMMGKRISIQPVSFREMSDILGGPSPSPMPPPPAPTALLRTPNDIDKPRRPLLPQGPREASFRERPRMEPPNRGNRPFLEPFKGHLQSGRPYGPGRMRGPWPNRPFNGNRPEGRFPPPPAEHGFGSPGCVVSINNLHFRAGLEELLDFFHGYKISKENIIRKYNENNQTTGEARVAFQTPRDAQRAVRELNQKSIMGRPLSLSILQ